MLFTRLLRTATLPTQCAICRGWDASRVCTRCLDRFTRDAWRCTRCALRLPDGVSVCGACLKEPPAFDLAVAAIDYSHPWDALIGRFKFNAALDLAPALVRCMADAWQRASMPQPALLVPVPLSSARLRERGYNQAWELTRRLARRLGCAAEPKLLLRVKDTPHQLALPPQRRAANVRAAFAVEPTRLAEVRGRRITLVDDVMTTGATAGEVARVLKQAGAVDVQLWVLARTPAPGE